MSMQIDITIHDSAFSPTHLRYFFKHTDDPDQDSYVVFVKGESSVNLHPDVIAACEEMEDDLCRIIGRMKENEEYVAPSRAREVCNVV